jgi:gluconokinase
MIVVMMGVSGSGKTAVGRLLARRLDWTYYEGDHFHSAANIEKMSKGISLTDRPGWQASERLLTSASHVARMQ